MSFLANGIVPFSSFYSANLEHAEHPGKEGRENRVELNEPKTEASEDDSNMAGERRN